MGEKTSVGFVLFDLADLFSLSIQQDLGKNVWFSEQLERITMLFQRIPSHFNGGVNIETLRII